ncbi:MAG TPA: DUF4338 domain-containing protein [Gemmatimonadales bacterium]|nr:DUF4338 domain-containing protein [Gemmatimonadales bacterium]
MSTLWRYRGREITAQDTAFIQGLVAQNPDWSRRRLSAELCRAWNWVQPNGQLRDMVARSLLLQLHRAGLIGLPAKRCAPPNNVVNRAAPAPLLPLWETPRRCPLAQLGPLDIRQVRRRPEEALFGQLLQAHHYLRYTQPVGEHLKYLICAGPEPIAALAWSSAPRHLEARDRYIGWPAGVRRENLHLIAYNTRFLILPWIHVPGLASHLLGRIARRIADDWQALYAHPIHLLETFIDPARFQGHCYRAANWICLGLTTGRGHNARTSRRDQPRKELWVYPLGADFRQRLDPRT